MTALQQKKMAMIKDRFNVKNLLYCGLFLWFVINLLQGLFTEIHADEAYYALYGEHLAWGYFDHPPMVALMTYLSSSLFSATLGVRFFTVVASCFTLLIVWKIATDSPCPTLRGGNAKRQSELVVRRHKVPEPVEGPTLRRILLFFTLACSVVMFNLYGFVTTPDASLLLFSALFLLIYQRYLEAKSWTQTVLMGLLMACMVYSKYHAFLLLGLIVLSNLRLLKDGKFWVACLVALVLLMPHILWQIHSGFPSLKYHLSQRSEPFRWSYFLEYLPNQLLVFNPFMFGAIVYVIASEAKQSRATSAQTLFERGLWFIFVGFFVFFWLMSFRGHVEPHWTAVCFIPTVVLVYRKALVDEKLRNYIRRFILPSLLLVAFMRVGLLTPLSASFGFYGKEPHYRAVESVAGERPVVFQGSFQHPALYHYFTGKESSTLRWYYDRATQYDLWQFDKAWLGQPVFVYGSASGQDFQVGEESFTGTLTDNFQTANRLELQFVLSHPEQTSIVHPDDTLRFDFTLHNPCGQVIEFQPEMMLKLLLVDDNEVRYGSYEPIEALEPDEVYQGRFSVVLGPETRWGKIRLLLCIGDRYALCGALRDVVEISVEKH